MPNKSKDQILREMKAEERRKAKVNKEKYIAGLVFPLVENLKTVYDAQTAFNAAAGFIQYALVAEEAKLLVSDLKIAMPKHSDKEGGEAVENILALTKDVAAKDVSDLLQRMGQKLAEYVANKGLKEKMTIKAKDFIA